VGGASDVDEALDEITDVRPDLILVGTDVGGAGVVAAVERILTLGGDLAVVALCTRADKALVDAAVRAGAAGSLDRDASDIDTITALHVYRDRQQGVEVDMKLAEPEAERPGLRVSGALPRFPTAPARGPDTAPDDAPTTAANTPNTERQPQPEPEPGSEPGPEAAGKAPKRKLFGLLGRRQDKKASSSDPGEDDEEMNSR
jgi:chemotaxis response regulator CheB